MKVFLDDERIAPPDWVSTRWPDEVIEWLKTGRVTELSLDHDLGDDHRGTGYDVLLWIEEQVVLHHFLSPVIFIHTANPAARKRMEQAVNSIQLGNQKYLMRNHPEQ